eukprot:1187322-Prorocentrum_minimum.AAC.3
MKLEREGISYTQQIEELIKKNREEEAAPPAVRPRCRKGLAAISAIVYKGSRRLRRATEDPNDVLGAVKTFDPPYLTGGVVARDTAKSVAQRRAPNGTFFQNTNPALFRERLPS